MYCDYGEYFVISERNFHSIKRLFDKKIIGQAYKTYNVHSGYSYIEEFKQLVADFMEFGLYTFWKQENSRSVNKLLKPDLMDAKNSLLNKYDMSVPIIILCIGYGFAFIIFLVEIILFKWRDHCINNVSEMGTNMKTRIKKRKLKLYKWKEKYIYNKKLRTKNDVLSSVLLKAIDSKKKIHQKP